MLQARNKEIKKEKLNFKEQNHNIKTMKKGFLLNNRMPLSSEEPKEDVTIEQVVVQTISDHMKTRQVSAFEAIWNNMQIPIVEMSQSPVFVSLNGINNDKGLVEFQLDPDLPEDSTNVHSIGHVIYYIQRPDILEKICLADFASCYEMINRKEGSTFYIEIFKQGVLKRQYFKKRSSPKVLGNDVPHPNEKRHSDEEDFTLYALFHHFRDLDELKTWEKANEKQRSLIKSNFQRHRPYQFEDLTLIYDSDSDYNSQCISEDESDDPEKEEEFNIGDNVDQTDENRENAKAMLINGTKSLNDLQAKVLAILAKSFEFVRSGFPGLKILVQGKAGTGKTFIIKMATLLASLNINSAGHPPTLRCAPTGVAADGISGETIHSKFGISIKSHSENYYLDMGAEKKASVQETLNNIQLFIVDEISMVGRLRWGQMNEAFKWALKTPNVQFGGITCFFTGRIMKLLISKFGLKL